MIKLDLKQNTKKKQAGALLQVEGELILEHAVEIRQALMDLVISTGVLSIDCTKVDRVDLSGLQLLCSMVRTVNRLNRELSIIGSDQPVFEQVIGKVGFPAGWFVEHCTEASSC